MNWMPDSFLVGTDGVLWCFLGVNEIHSLRGTCVRMSHLVTRARQMQLEYDQGTMGLSDVISTPIVWATLHSLRVRVDLEHGLAVLLRTIGHLPELAHLRVHHGMNFAGVVHHQQDAKANVSCLLGSLLPLFFRLKSFTIDLVTPAECSLIASLWHTGCVMPNLQDLSINCSLMLHRKEAPEALVARLTAGTRALPHLRSLLVDISTMPLCDPVVLVDTISGSKSLQRLTLVLERMHLDDSGGWRHHVALRPTRPTPYALGGIQTLWLSLNHTPVAYAHATALLDALRLRLPGLQEWQFGLYGCGSGVVEALAVTTPPPLLCTTGLVMGGDCVALDGLRPALRNLLLQNTSICVRVVGTLRKSSLTAVASALQMPAVRGASVRLCLSAGDGGTYWSVLRGSSVVARLLTLDCPQIHQAFQAMGLTVVSDLAASWCTSPLDARPLLPMHAPRVTSTVR
jgi:hypothetical protein